MLSACCAVRQIKGGCAHILSSGLRTCGEPEAQEATSPRRFIAMGEEAFANTDV